MGEGLRVQGYKGIFDLLVPLDPYTLRPLGSHENFEHLVVDEEVGVGLVGDVGAVGVEGAEVAAEVPEGVADVVGF